MAAELLNLTVTSVATEATDIVVLELADVSGAPLPGFSAGAHIDLHLANGLVRSYSLLNLPNDQGRYTIAVQRDAASRGGSSFIHDTLKRGDTITANTPRNNFVLEESADYYVLLAGGIGITPLLAMQKRLEQLQKPWKLYYCARTRHHALLGHLPENDERVFCNFDQEPGGSILNIGHVLESAPDGAHFYCCGPAPMLKTFTECGSNMDPTRFHVEYFSAAHAPQKQTSNKEFELVLAKSGQTLKISNSTSILEVLIENGFDLSYSCMEGVCGSCETEVLEGEPDHHDLVLSAADRSSGKTMMICCSGSKTKRLILNI